MSNIVDYLKWRGDLTIDQDPFNEVDALIFSRLAYVHFDGIVSSDFKNSISVSEAAKKMFSGQEDLLDDQIGDDAIVSDKDNLKFFGMVSRCERFKNMHMCGYETSESGDQDVSKQFAAVSFYFKRSEIYIWFRGTEDTPAGWKEDFSMIYDPKTPSQEEAVTYLNRIASQFRTSGFVLGGHSKGGNLANYAASFCENKYKRRITAIYDHDAPGFNEIVSSTDEVKSVIPKIHSYIPQSSIVGLMLEPLKRSDVVYSVDSYMGQHNIFTWQVSGNTIVRKDGLSAKSTSFDKTLDDWIRNLRFEDREKFVDCLFILLENADMGTYEKMTSNWLESAKEIIKSYSNMSSNVKKVLNRAVSVLFESVNENRKAAGGGKKITAPGIIKKIDKKIRRSKNKE